MRFIQAKHYHVGRLKPIRLIVIHDMEIGEKADTAEACARMFATTTRDASAHYCIDADSIVQCVKDGDTAWHAPGANSDGIGLEHAGFASQSVRDWLDDYSTAMLRDQSAPLVARLCVKYDIPIKRLTNAELADGKRGIVSHAQVSAVYKKSTHTDPGPDFPWTTYLGWVREAASPAPAPTPIPEDDMPLTDADADKVVSKLLARTITTGWQEDGSFDPSRPVTIPLSKVFAGDRGGSLHASAVADQLMGRVVGLEQGLNTLTELVRALAAPPPVDPVDPPPAG